MSVRKSIFGLILAAITISGAGAVGWKDSGASCVPNSDRVNWGNLGEIVFSDGSAISACRMGEIGGAVSCPAGSVPTTEYTKLAVSAEQFYQKLFPQTMGSPEALNIAMSLLKDGTSTDGAFIGCYNANYKAINYCEAYAEDMSEADKERCNNANKNGGAKAGLCPEKDYEYDAVRNVCIKRSESLSKSPFCPTIKDKETGVWKSACAHLQYKCKSGIYHNGSCYSTVVPNLDYIVSQTKYPASNELGTNFGDVPIMLKCQADLTDEGWDENNNASIEENSKECKVDRNGFAYCAYNLKECDIEEETRPSIHLNSLIGTAGFQCPPGTSRYGEDICLPDQCRGNGSSPVLGSDGGCYPLCAIDPDYIYGTHPKVDGGSAFCAPATCSGDQRLGVDKSCHSPCTQSHLEPVIDPATGEQKVDPATGELVFETIIDYQGYSFGGSCQNLATTEGSSLFISQSEIRKIRVPNNYSNIGLTSNLHLRKNPTMPAWYDHRKNLFNVSMGYKTITQACPNTFVSLDINELAFRIVPDYQKKSVSEKIDVLLKLANLSNSGTYVKEVYDGELEFYGVLSETFYGCIDPSAAKCEGKDKLDKQTSTCTGPDGVYKATFDKKTIDILLGGSGFSSTIDRFPIMVKSKCDTQQGKDGVHPSWINPPMLHYAINSCQVHVKPGSDWALGLAYPGHSASTSWNTNTPLRAWSASTESSKEYFVQGITSFVILNYSDQNKPHWFNNYGDVGGPIYSTNDPRLKWCPSQNAANIYQQSWKLSADRQTCTRETYSCNGDPKKICARARRSEIYPDKEPSNTGTYSYACSPNPCFDKTDIEDVEIKDNDKKDNGWVVIQPGEDQDQPGGGDGAGNEGGDNVEYDEEDKGKTCNDNIYIFNGESKTCRKKDKLGGLTGGGCCKKDKTFINLIDCKPHEKELRQKREEGRCHEIGDYCSKKLGVPKVCVTTSTTFCCFGSKLARIIHEQGRPQINFGWGTPESPQCRGFLPQEFEKLDFSEMDLSEFTADIQQQATASIPAIEHLQGELSTTLKNSMTTGKVESAIDQQKKFHSATETKPYLDKADKENILVTKPQDLKAKEK